LLKLTFAFVPSGSSACWVSSCVSLITYFGILTDVYQHRARTLSDRDWRNGSQGQRHGSPRRWVGVQDRVVHIETTGWRQLLTVAVLMPRTAVL
jgi:hypothetical protein